MPHLQWFEFAKFYSICYVCKKRVGMLTRSDVISVLEKSKDKLQNQFGVEKLVLFGSFARNQQTEESDIDVFVTMPAKLFGVIAVKQYLEDIIGLKVDVVRNHKRLNESLLNEIQRDGIDIFECKGFFNRVTQSN